MRTHSLLLPLCITFALSISQAGKNTCSTKDFKSELGPVRDQGSVGWCFAYVTADMLTQKLRKLNPKKFAKEQVSAADVTFQYFKNPPNHKIIPYTDSSYWAARIQDREQVKIEERNNDVRNYGIFDNFQGGFIDLSIYSYPIETKGVCLEKDLSSKRGIPMDLLLGINFEYSDKARSCYQNADSEKALVELRNKIWEEHIDHQCKRTTVNLKKSIRSVDGWTHAPKFSGDGTVEFFSENEKGQSQNLTSRVRSELRDVVNEGLDNGSIVGIGITPAFLMNAESRDKMLRDNIRHEVSIVARQKLGNQCMYQIRNSWGEDCKLYNEHFQGQCDKGNIWVSEEELFPHMMRAHYLQN